jgi:flagellar M-ring protein FliF
LAEPDIGNEGQSSTYSKLDETQNFEVGKTVTQEEKSFGTVERITVAVVVNDKRQVTGEGENRQVEYVQRSPEELEKIRNLVATAVGYDEQRGDVIEVSNISFDTSEQDVAQSGLIQDIETTSLINSLIKYGIGLVVLLLFYFLVIRKIMKKLSQYETGETVAAGEGAGEGIDFTVGEDIKFPKTIEELEKEIESELEENAPIDTDSVKNKVMLRKIEDAAKDDPEMLANLIKVWLRE